MKKEIIFEKWSINNNDTKIVISILPETEIYFKHINNKNEFYFDSDKEFELTAELLDKLLKEFDIELSMTTLTIKN